MNRLATWIASAAILAAVPSPSTAQTCSYVKLSLSFDDLTFPDPLPGFDLCVSGPAVGTLRGTMLSCVRFADLVPSDAIWHDGSDAVLAGWWYDEIHTTAGTITITERGMVDGATGLQATMMTITGGSGAYAGATGLLTAAPEWPNRTTGFGIQGTLCTP